MPPVPGTTGRREPRLLLVFPFGRGRTRVFTAAAGCTAAAACGQKPSSQNVEVRFLVNAFVPPPAPPYRTVLKEWTVRDLGLPLGGGWCGGGISKQSSSFGLCPVFVHSRRVGTGKKRRAKYQHSRRECKNFPPCYKKPATAPFSLIFRIFLNLGLRGPRDAPPTTIETHRWILSPTIKYLLPSHIRLCVVGE